LGIGENDAPLVAAIISIADSLGMKAVAEGIESKPVLEKLIKMGCDLGQGYYWNKPLPAPEIEQFLSNHPTK
jgi:EAL domain-containing protein (putative c-di-GMP-specific phosphodiesterase class I)